jgi:two-component sensor histidine kinase
MLPRFFLLLSFLFTIKSYSQNTGDVFNDSIFYSGRYLLKVSESDVDSKLLDIKKFSLTQQIHLFYCKGGFYLNRNQHDSALIYYKKAESLLKKVSVHPIKQASLYYFIAFIHDANNIDNRNHVLPILLKADSLIQKSYHGKILGYIRDFIVEVYRESGKLDQALKWLEDTEKIYKEHNDSISENLLITKVSVLNQLGDKTGDINYYKQALLIANYLISSNQLFNIDAYKVKILAEKGVALSNLGNSNDAINYFKDARNINLSLGYVQSATLQDLNIFHELKKQNNYKAIIELGPELITKCKEYGFENRLVEIYHAMYLAYDALKNLKEANNYLRLYVEAKEENLKKQYSDDLEELGEKYKSTLKDLEIQKINTEKQQVLLEKKTKEKELFYVVLGLSIITILLAIAIITAFKFKNAKSKIQQQSEELKQTNIQLDKEIKQKNFLFRELHHRVKNNFQLIISFLRLQEKIAGNLTLEEFIKNSELKMNAMSLVHEMLYKEGNTETINIKGYILELSESIVNAFGNEKCDVDFKIYGDNISLSIGKAVSIGLVINELITNSIKHGGEEELEIAVKIFDKEDKIELIYKDNGKGFPENFNPEVSKSLGVRAIILLMSQINAQVLWKNNNGVEWQFLIPKT